MMTELVFPQHFKFDEMKCHYTHELDPPNMKAFQDLLDNLEKMRLDLDFPLIVNSGWRSLKHPIEKRKKKGAIHRHYIAAVDIQAHSSKADRIMEWAYTRFNGKRGWHSVATVQKGPMESRYIHLDNLHYLPPIWSY